MTEAERDRMLREMAANRGWRLVKSRRRKPGGDYGRFGLKDAKSGEEVLGFGAAGLTASGDEVEAWLRGSAAAGWKSSLRAAGGAKRKSRRATASRPVGPAPPDPEPEPEPEPTREPELRIREADSVDSEAIAALAGEAGFEGKADDIAERLARLARAGEPPLLAKLGEAVVGCVVWHVTPVLHRPHPVGRLTWLEVAATARRRGIGRALVEAAETRLAARGCGLVEVTSNVSLKRAHAFYRRLGYERTSYRFAKPVSAGG
jgi:ribosomal protein S18 acetylase RimI-like enzyme